VGSRLQALSLFEDDLSLNTCFGGKKLVILIDMSDSLTKEFNQFGMGARDRINYAALDLFVRRGIKGTTIREIAKNAGIAEVTIYRHFKGKHEIASSLFTRYIEQFYRKMVDSIEFLSHPIEKLYALIDAFFEFSSEEPLAYKYVNAGHSNKLSAMLHEVNKPKDVFSQVIAEGIDRGVFSEIEVNLATAMVVGILTRVITFQENGLISYDHESVVKQVKNSTLNVLV